MPRPWAEARSWSARARREQLETLDHVVRTLTPDTLLIADAAGALGIAGVMGGAGSEVSQPTTAAIIESAVFDPVSIRRTAFRYGLRSEASLRFEKGQESRLARVGADRTAQLLAEWAGGRVAVGAVDTNPVEERRGGWPSGPPASTDCWARRSMPADARALARVEIDNRGRGEPEQLVAIVPTHRRDIDIEADVIEEICRLRGYEKLPPRLPASHARLPADPRLRGHRARPALRPRPSEVVTNGLIAPEDHAAWVTRRTTRTRSASPTL